MLLTFSKFWAFAVEMKGFATSFFKFLYPTVFVLGTQTCWRSYTSKMAFLSLLVLWLALVWESISCDIVCYLSCGNASSLFISLHALAWGQREMFHSTEELTLEVASGNQSCLCFFFLVLLTVTFLSSFLFCFAGDLYHIIYQCCYKACWLFSHR